MYHNQNNNFFHGITFHHFHDDEMHQRSPGSLDKDSFYKMINFIGKNNILDADVFLEKLKKNKIKENEVCLTFDDGVKSQIDIALPILEELKIKSFFFVYSSIFKDKPNNLEIFRYFRTNYFDNVDKFYNNFYKVLDKNLITFFKNNDKKIKEAKIKFQFYSIEDIKFRLVRDNFLTKSQYEETMFLMIKEKKIKYEYFTKKLNFEKDDLIKLDSLGHLVGLHTHSHPTLLEALSYDEQKNEYEECLSTISNILNKSRNEINYMAHPCGSYNNDTLEILKKLGVDLGFKQIMTIEPKKGMKKINNSLLEIAREDCAQIQKRINFF